MRGKPGCVIYVGELPADIRERELEDLFYKYGRIRNVDLKINSRPPAFAFLEFEDPRDAKDAVRGRDGYEFAGRPIRVEVARGTTGPPSAPGNWRDKGTGYRIIVEGLPRSASWQDLKDMFRKVKPPVYTNVYRDDTGVFGVVEYDSASEVREIIRELRDARFKNPWEECRVRLVNDCPGDRSGGRDSRSRSPRSRSPRSRSPSAKRSPSRSPSPRRSPRARSTSRSPERRRD